MEKPMPVDLIPEGFYCFEILKMDLEDLNIKIKICPYLEIDQVNNIKKCKFLDGVEVFDVKECQIKLIG